MSEPLRIRRRTSPPRQGCFRAVGHERGRGSTWPRLAAALAVLGIWLVAPALVAAEPLGEDAAARTGAAAAPASEEPPGPLSAAKGPPGDLGEELARLLDRLDSDDYAERRDAAEAIEAMIRRHEDRADIALRLERLLKTEDVSFEVRHRVRLWLAELPRVVVPPPEALPPEAIDELVERLAADEFARRTAAFERLDWVLSNPRLAWGVLGRLTRRMSEPGMAAEDAAVLEPAWRRAWEAWLLAGDTPEGRPEPTDAELGTWIRAVCGTGVLPPSEPEGAIRAESSAAGRELLVAVSRDELVPRVRRALEEAAADGPGPREAVVLAQWLALLRPALVAEFWQGRCHMGEQHLLVGVPSQSAGAARPSHFDRIDDRTAHCLSGNTLEPGDYPVGVAFPHPTVEEAFFHLVNLPTPRRRLAYAVESRLDEAARLRRISRSTLERFVARGASLDERELVMLEGLDPAEVSRFAGDYFARVDDQPLPHSGIARFGGRPSRHGLLCGLLAREGTRDAGPGLVAAIAKGAFRPPTSAAPYRLEYLAALAIARRDPWPGADDWLAETAARDEPLAENLPEGPTVGATAAAILLKRHEEPAARFDLREAPEPLLMVVELEGWRFTTAEGPAKLRRWWQSRQPSAPTDRAARRQGVGGRLEPARRTWYDTAAAG